MSRTLEPNSSTFAFRDIVQPQDLASIRDIAQSTEVFHPWEVDIAVELAEERLAKGEASGYSFLFADSNGSTVLSPSQFTRDVIESFHNPPLLR